MIVLLDTSHDLTTCAGELGCEVGQLLTPLTGFRLRHPERPWAIDNGAFSGFDETYLRSRPWLVRSNGSNVVGAAVDSLIFPTIAFGGFLPHIVVMQFAAKVGGGAVWAWLLRKRFAAA